VLVVGAGGFVGANLVRRLMQGGQRVIGTIRPAGHRWRLEGLRGELELREVELRDEDAVVRLVTETSPDWIFNLATHDYWDSDLRAQVDTNLLATSSLLHAAANSGCEVFVNAGTSSEYGFKDHAPVEDELPEPNTPYAVAKAAATLLCRQVSSALALRTVTLRLYSVYGPYEHPRRLIPRLIVNGLRGELPPLADPGTRRDFVAVDDVVEAFVRSAAAWGSQAGAVYNVGSGVATSLSGVVDIARRTLPIEAEPDWGSLPSRDWDTSVWVSNSARAGAELGWAPRRDLEGGFKETVDWLCSEPSVWEVYGVRG
jgi:dolichol-phosphate mannosyltransferase